MQPNQNPIDFDSQGNMLIPSVRSPNYVSGSSGWAIRQDGSSEFNNMSIRGIFNGTNFIINLAGIFLYSATPANGNLIGSWTSASGTDGFGNAYQAGFTVQSAGAASSINLFGEILKLTATNATTLKLQSGSNSTILFTPPNGTWRDGTIDGDAASSTSHPTLRVSSPTDVPNGVASSLFLQGSSTTSTATSITANATNFTMNAIASMGNVAVGSVNITPSAANTPTSAIINYGPLLGTSFFGFVSPLTQFPGTVVTGVSMTGVGSSSATVWLTRTNTTQTTIEYIVWGV